MKIRELSEGLFQLGPEKQFLRADDPALLTLQHTVEVCVRPFLVISEGEAILLDAGLGSYTNGALNLYQALQQAAVLPQKVSRILLSHLHKDHTNGIGHWHGADFEPHFPNAAIYINKEEFAFARSQQGNPSYNQPMLEWLGQLPQVKWITEPEGYINSEITYSVVGGHTPFHQVFWIKNEEGITFYPGDNLPQAYYLKYHAAYKNDYDGKRAMELRLQWEQEAKAENWSVLLYHDVKRDRILLADK